jgi:CheY-like chemotaxis protein
MKTETVMARVLVAESDAALATRYGACLRREGYDVHFAADGLDCWTRLHELRPTVLLLQWELPWGGGDGVVARLREDWRGPDIFVAVTMADPIPVNSVELSQTPVRACLRKPLRLVALKKALQKVSRSGRIGFWPHRMVRIVRGPLAGLTGTAQIAHSEGPWLIELPSVAPGVYVSILPTRLDLTEMDSEVAQNGAGSSASAVPVLQETPMQGSPEGKS